MHWTGQCLFLSTLGIQPRIAPNLFQGGSFFRVFPQHWNHQSLTIWTKEFKQKKRKCHTRVSTDCDQISALKGGRERERKAKMEREWEKESVKCQNLGPSADAADALPLSKRQCQYNQWFLFVGGGGGARGGGEIVAATRQYRGNNICSTGPVGAELFAWLTELSLSGVRDTCASSRYVRHKKRKNYWLPWHCPFQFKKKKHVNGIITKWPRQRGLLLSISDHNSIDSLSLLYSRKFSSGI